MHRYELRLALARDPAFVARIDYCDVARLESRRVDPPGQSQGQVRRHGPTMTVCQIANRITSIFSLV